MKKILLSGAMLIAYMSGANAQSATVNCFIEEFTSSTCPPCKSFNAWFDPMMQTDNANGAGSGIVLLKYQQDFPAVAPPKQLDFSFNAHSDQRATYYYAGQSWGIPAHRMNGPEGAAYNQSMWAADFNSCLNKGTTPKVDITGTYTIKGDSIFMQVTVTPKVAMTGNYHVRVATAEKHYENTANTTGQLHYYHVMREMYPNSTGTAVTAWVASTPQTFTFKDKVTVGSVTKGSFNFWNNPYLSNMIVWVQDEADKSVLQSEAIGAKWATAVQDVEKNIANVLIFPNPTPDKAILMFTADKASNVTINVFDAVGRIVYSEVKAITAGEQRILIPADNFASGTYNVSLQSETGKVSTRFSVVK